MTGEVDALLRRSAQEVAISLADAEDALRSVSNATTLLREIRGRIREGSNRLSDALHRAYHLRDAGDIVGACKQLEDVLAVEVVHCQFPSVNIDFVRSGSLSVDLLERMKTVQQAEQRRLEPLKGLTKLGMLLQQVSPVPDRLVVEDPIAQEPEPVHPIADAPARTQVVGHVRERLTDHCRLIPEHALQEGHGNGLPGSAVGPKLFSQSPGAPLPAEVAGDDPGVFYCGP